MSECFVYPIFGNYSVDFWNGLESTDIGVESHLREKFFLKNFMKILVYYFTCKP